VGHGVIMRCSTRGVPAEKVSRGDIHANVPLEGIRKKAAMQYPKGASSLHEGEPTVGDSPPNMGPRGAGRVPRC